MSSMMNPTDKATTDQQKQQGNETFLSPEERAQLQRMMGHPTDYPKEMMAHIKGWLEVNPPDFPASTFKGKGVPRYIDRAVAASMTASSGTGEDTMYSYTLKARTVSPTGQLRILFFFSAQSPDVSNDCTVRIKLGATTVVSFLLATDQLDGNARQHVADIKIVNAGSYSSQLAYLTGVKYTESGAVNTILGIGSSSVDLSQDRVLSITNQWSSGDANDIVTPSYVAVEVFNPVGA